MRAAIVTAYGPPDVMRVNAVSDPICGSDEILVRVHAASVTSADARLRRADPAVIRVVSGVSKPRKPVLGSTFSGTVERVGAHAMGFDTGEEVFGTTDLRLGTHAELVAIPATGLVYKKPERITCEQAAAIPFGYSTSLHFLRKAGISPGQRVFINGATGNLGIAAVQLTQQFDCEVSGTCSDTNLEFLRSTGVAEAFDYSTFPQTNDIKPFDIVFDTVGQLPLGVLTHLLNEHGRYASAVHMKPSRVVRGAVLALRSHQSIMGGMCSENHDDLRTLKQWCEDGDIDPVIDRRFALDDVVDAHAHIENHQKRGTTVLSISP